MFTRFIKDEFASESKPTIGVEFTSKIMPIEDKVVKAQIWDVAGQERFQILSRNYYRGAVGALLIYDITQYKTFANAEKWLAGLLETAEPNVLVVLVGNKSDLEDMRAVSQEEAIEFAKKHGLMWMETSVLESNNIEEGFQRLLTGRFFVKRRGEFDCE